MTIMYTDIDHPSLDIERGVIEGAGLSFTVHQSRTEDDVIANCKEADILINQYAPITARVMDNLPNFKMVVRYGVGVDNIEVAEAVKRGIVVCNIPDYGTNEVADQALALMMALVRKVVYMNRRTKEDAWDSTMAFTLGKASRRMPSRVRPSVSDSSVISTTAMSVSGWALRKATAAPGDATDSMLPKDGSADRASFSPITNTAESSTKRTLIISQSLFRGLLPAGFSYSSLPPAYPAARG